MESSHTLEQAPATASASCPLCGCVHLRSGRRFTSSEVAQRYIRREVDKLQHGKLKSHIELLWGRANSEFLECGACNFEFASPFIAGDSTFYELSSDRTNYPERKWEYQKTVDRLRRTRLSRRRTGSLLDIGAGNGAFLRAITRAGWPKDDVIALEYSRSGVQKMSEHGFKCHRIGVMEFEPEDPVDVVCLFQVLEHMDAPDDVLKRIAGFSAPGADLFIAVPNGMWQRANDAEGIGDDFPPNHISRWSRRTLSELAGRSGWEVTEFELEPTGRLWSARYAAVVRFLRNSERSGSLANQFIRLARRMPGKKSGRTVLAAGALLQPACWSIAGRRALFASPPCNIWVHLTRKTPAVSVAAVAR